MARGDCASAVPALEAASLSRDSPKVAQQAGVLLGKCLLDAGDLAGADRSFVALMDSPDSAISRRARLEHARVLRQQGDYDEALATLEGLEGNAVDAERAADYAGLGDLARAEPLIEQAIARQDLAVPWDSTLASVGRVDPGLASRLTTEVIAIPGITGELRDNLLIADGMRLLPIVPDSGLARLQVAADAQPMTNASLLAKLRVTQVMLGQADTLAQLERAREELTELAQYGGPSSVQAIRYLRVMDRVKAYADSITPGKPEGDLATFVVAESVRDSLPTPRIAAELFGAIPVWWPESPYAPKALLALAALEPQRADSIFRSVEVAYPASPYLQLVAGDVTPAVLALEDSLQAYGLLASGAARPATRGRPATGTRAPAAQRQQDELK